jgi:HEAT repeat protein
VAAPLLTSPSPDVRIAALKAMLRLEPSSAVPHLAAAAQDPDASVRRRASLLGLSLRGEEALKLSQQTTRDVDPEVRRLTVLALGASGHVQAKAQLLDFMSDADVRVRRAASQSLGRLLGRDVSGLIEMEDAQRRRELRRLMATPAQPVVSPVSVRASAVAPVASAATVTLTSVVAVAAEPAVSPPASIEPLCGSLMAEIRCAIRGRTLSDLTHATSASEMMVEQACELLVARGQVIKRGLKYFTA